MTITITAKKDTYVKKSTAQSSTLPSTEKRLYKAGDLLAIEKAESAANGHIKATLGFAAGVWYIFESDWSSIVGKPSSVPQVPASALKIITEFEGFVNHVYDDGLGIPTIGIGTTRYPDGRPVRFGDPDIDEETAQTYLAYYLGNTVVHLSETIPYWNEMNDSQRSALLSFAYNLGDYFYGDPGFNSITAALRERRWDDIPRILTLYSNPHDPVVHAGLLRRRQAEARLWQGQE